MIIIDRFEKDFAVCETDSGMTDIRADMLSDGLCEGDVIIFDGERYVKDTAATNARLEKIKKIVSRKAHNSI